MDLDFLKLDLDFGTWKFGRDLNLDSGTLDVDFGNMELGL